MMICDIQDMEKRFPDRAKWQHPVTTIVARPWFNDVEIELAINFPAPRDRRNGLSINLSPDQARALARQLLCEADMITQRKDG